MSHTERQEMKRQQAQPWNLRTENEEIAQQTYHNIGRFTEKSEKNSKSVQ